MRELLVRHVRAHAPVVDTMWAKVPERSRWARCHVWMPRPMVGATIAGMSVLVLGSGVAFAAEHALPGELLYPMKVHLNEEVRAAFSVGPRARAAWNTRRAERRLEEFESLLAAGRLDDRTPEELADRFTAHARAATAVMGQMESQGAGATVEELRSDLEGSLRAHDDILARLEPRARERVRGVRGHVQSLLTDTTNARVVGEAQVRESKEGPAPGTAERRVARAATAIARVEQVIARAEGRAHGDTVRAARARVVRAQEDLRAARAVLGTGAAADAMLRADAAFRVAREAQALLRVDGTLQLRTRLPESTANGDAHPPDVQLESSDDARIPTPGSSVRADDRSGDSPAGSPPALRDVPARGVFDVQLVPEHAEQKRRDVPRRSGRERRLLVPDQHRGEIRE
ncbi:hypothetical protein HYV74_03130 [Candidatus Uhrbacteria bacterium]|nr:hypothetical protein [Candidatus Uhrbacteria bacterium]